MVRLDKKRFMLMGNYDYDSENFPYNILFMFDTKEDFISQLREKSVSENMTYVILDLDTRLVETVEHTVTEDLLVCALDNLLNTDPSSVDKLSLS